MSHRASHHHYHALRLTELKRLYWAHTLQSLAITMSMIFVPIFLYRLEYSVTSIMGYYLWFSVMWGVIQYPVMRFSNAIGFNRAMGLGMLVHALQVLMLATISQYHWPLWLIAFVWALFVALYWPSFRASFAQSLLHRRVVPAVGLSSALVLLAYGVAPAIGGAIATQFGITVLYFVAIGCFIAAALPLLSGPEIIKKASFNIRVINLRRTWRDLTASMGDNIDDSVGSIIWPFFIFLLVPSYVGVGLLSSVGVIASILISLYIGQRKIVQATTRFIKRGTLVVAVSNALRILTQSAGQIAGVSFISGLGHALMYTPYDSRYYQNAEREPLLPYVFAMMMAGSLACIILFGILFAVSLVASLQVVLIVGLAMAVPAGYVIRLMRP